MTCNSLREDLWRASTCEGVQRPLIQKLLGWWFFNPWKIDKIKTHFHINLVPTRAYACVCDTCHICVMTFWNQCIITCCRQVYGLRSSGKTHSHKPKTKHWDIKQKILRHRFTFPPRNPIFLHGCPNGGEDRKWLQTDWQRQKLKICDMMTWCDSGLFFPYWSLDQLGKEENQSVIVVLSCCCFLTCLKVEPWFGHLVFNMCG